MAIVGYSGLPGSGKSYGVVENVVIPALKNGRHIITNIPLKIGRLSDDFPKGKITLFTNKDVEENPNFFSLDEHPAGVIWIIDEAWRYWRSGQKSTNIPEHEKSFFTEHRHCVGEDGHTNEIVLVTQDLAQICSFVRSLIEETFKATKMTAIGQSKMYKIAVYAGAATGQKNGKALRNLAPKKYSQDVYQYYKSHTKNKTDFAAGMEEKVDDRGNILKSPLFRFGIPLAVLIMVFAVYRVMAYFDIDTEQAPSTPAKPAKTSSKTAIARTVRSQSSFELESNWLPVSDSWRIVGRINDVLLIWGEHGTREIHSRNCAKMMKTGEDYCVIQNQLVTYYSYKQPDIEEEERFNVDFAAQDSAF